MNELGRLLLLAGIVGLALTVLGGVFVWSMEETRRIRRGLKRVLGVEPHALLIAQGRGKGVGFDFTRNRLAVAWDTGAWCLIYRVEELVGAELIVDGQVTARVHRGETRRALDAMGAQGQVRLRLVFDDPRWPDFNLDLWHSDDANLKGGLTAAEAIQEANRWLARTEAMLRQIAARRPCPAPVMAPEIAQPAPAPVQPRPQPDLYDEDEDDRPPF